jgi:hypothetical protein
VGARKEGSSARTLLFPLVSFGILWKEGGFCCDLGTKLVGFGHKRNHNNFELVGVVDNNLHLECISFRIVCLDYLFVANFIYASRHVFILFRKNSET